MPEAEPTNPCLRWAIKRSFVDYVMRMPDGRGWVIEGATATESNEFVFEWAGSESSEDGSPVWKFHGEVGMYGHSGMLLVRITDPWLTVRGDQATLSVGDPLDEQGGRFDLVTVELAPADLSWTGAAWSGDPVKLTAKATSTFNDVYSEGELFEPLLVLLPPDHRPA